MKVFCAVLCLGLVVAGCHKTTTVVPYQSQGTLTGYDLRECPNCGGLDITIKNDTSKNPPNFYEINSTLAKLGIPESTPFPISVSLDWKPDSLPLGAYHYIIVTKIKVNN